MTPVERARRALKSVLSAAGGDASAFPAPQRNQAWMVGVDDWGRVLNLIDADRTPANGSEDASSTLGEDDYGQSEIRLATAAVFAIHAEHAWSRGNPWDALDPDAPAAPAWAALIADALAEDGDAANAIELAHDAGLEAIKAALLADPTLGGAVDMLWFGYPTEADLALPGIPRLKAMEIPIFMILIADTPIG